METTYDDVANGTRLDISVEFVTRRPVDCEGGRAHRLLVADDSERLFAVLVPPENDPLLDLKTGASYRLTDLLGSDPVARRGDGADHSGREGRLRTGRAVGVAESAVAEAATRLDIDEPFGVVDARTSVQRI